VKSQIEIGLKRNNLLMTNNNVELWTFVDL
jgi:hypothetical protein